jgi:hypothetical protein
VFLDPCVHPQAPAGTDFERLAGDDFHPADRDHGRENQCLKQAVADGGELIRRGPDADLFELSPPQHVVQKSQPHGVIQVGVTEQNVEAVGADQRRQPEEP